MSCLQTSEAATLIFILAQCLAGRLATIRSLHIILTFMGTILSIIRPQVHNLYFHTMGGSPGELRTCDVGEAKEGLENEL